MCTGSPSCHLWQQQRQRQALVRVSDDERRYGGEEALDRLLKLIGNGDEDGSSLEQRFDLDMPLVEAGIDSYR